MRALSFSLFFSILLAVLVVAALPAPALAQFGAADLTGTWRIHALGVAPTGVETGGWGRGSIATTAGAVVPGGSIVTSGGETTTFTGGRLSISATGAVTGSVTNAGGSMAVQGQMLPNKQAVVALVTSGSGASMVVDYVVLVRAATSGFAQADLAGSWRIFGLETPWDVDTSFGGWIRGTITLDDAGTPTGGSVRYSDGGGPDTFTGGAVTLFEDGRVQGTVSSQSPGLHVDDVTFTGVMLPAKDLIVGVTTTVARDNANVREFGFFFLQRAPEVTYSQAVDLPGSWQLHGLSLNAPDADTGFGLIGPVTFSGTGGLTGVLATRTTVNGSVSISPSTLALDAQGNFTGSFNVNVSGVGPLIVDVDASMLPTKDVIVGVLTIRSASTGHVAYSVFSLVKQAAVVQFSLAAYRGNEGSAVRLTLSRTGALANNLAVEVATTNGTATPGVDYTALSQMVTIPAGATTAFLDVSTAQDGEAEGDETVGLVLRNPTGGAVIGPRGTATLTIVDDEQALQFSAAAYQVSEATATATITVLRSGPATGTVSVSYATAADTAVIGTDYPNDVMGTLTFLAGQTSKTFTVPLLNDTVVDGLKRINLSLNTPVGVLIGNQGTAVLTITDNDSGGIIQFSAATYAVTEPVGPGNGVATITVTRTGTNLASGVMVQYATNAGTAAAGADYTEQSGTLTFAAGQTSKTFTVPILHDTLDELNETVNLALSPPTGGATLGTRTTATLTITDNDVGGAIRFGSATYGVAENVAGGTTNLTVTRTGGVASGVTVQYAVTGGTATGADYTLAAGTLTFAAGVTNLPIPVTILDDGLAEGNETVVVTLSNPTGGATLGTPSTATLTIVDDEVVVQFRDLQYSVNEGSGLGAVISVVRTGPVGNAVTVDYATSDGSATAGFDYTAVNGRLTFSPFVVGLTFTVPIREDALIEGEETVRLTLSNPIGCQIGPRGTAGLVIVDNDLGGMIKFNPATYMVVEGNTATITVVRSGGLGGPVTVDYAVTGGTATGGGVDYTLVDGTLTFNANETTKTFTIATVSDAITEGNETVILSLSNAQGGTTVGIPYTATLTITDAQRLQVLKNGTGSGTVTSSPAGINCGADCSEGFVQGTRVTLTATPASGSTFTGWSGACAGTGSCMVTMDAAKAVTATFNFTSSSATISVNPSSLTMRAPICFNAPCKVSGMVTVTSPTPWTSANGCYDPVALFSRGFSVCPSGGAAGQTVVEVSTMVYGESTPLDFSTLLTRGDIVRFTSTTTIGIGYDLNVVVELPYCCL